MFKDFKETFTSYNISDFTEGKNNLLYITGFSGSGKSTFAERLFYKYDVTNIELDNIDPKNGYIYNQVFSDKNEIFYDFLDNNPVLNEKIKGPDRIKYRQEVFDAFFPFAEKWCKEHKDKKYSIEGTQIYEFPNNIDRDLPIIIMNASAKESADRKYKRDLEYDKTIVSKENIKKMEDFEQSLKNHEKEESSMLKVSDEQQFKILPMSLDLIYRFKDKTNKLGECKFNSKTSNGLIATTFDERTLVGYIVVNDHKLSRLKVMPEFKNSGMSEKLTRYAIEKFGLNDILIPTTSEKLIKTFQKIGFKVVSSINGKVNLKLRSIIVRKNNYEDLIVRRENGIDTTTNDEEFVYYFSKEDNLTQVARLAIIPSKKYISSLKMYKGFETQADLEKILDFATVEKGCKETRLPYGDKEKLSMYEKYGFEITKRVKNSKGKFYVLELMEKAKFESDKALMEWLEENVTTSDFVKLMSPVQVEKELRGSSHDQAQFILAKLPYKYNANAILVVEKNIDDNILKSYTIVTYRKGDKIYWIENAMPNALGINGPYNDLDELESDVLTKFDYANKAKDKLDFIPIYVKFNKPVDLKTYIKNIITLEE